MALIDNNGGDGLRGSLQNFEAVSTLLRSAPFSKGQLEQGYLPFLKENSALERAEAIVADSMLFGIDWPLKVWRSEVQPQLSIPYYEIPCSDFGKVSDEDAVAEVAKAHGIGLNWGALLRYGRACEAGRRLLGEKWPGRCGQKMSNPKDHLATIEELIWLSLWRNVANVESEVCLGDSKRSKNVDWRFESCGVTVNLEVKYRARDWIRSVDGPAYSIAMPSYYSDVDGKFPGRRDGELNLVGITSYAPPDRSWREETEAYLASNPQIDAVVLWSPSFNADDGSPFEVHSKYRVGMVKKLLQPSKEDKQHIVAVLHPWKERDNRRVDRKARVLQALAEYPDRARRRLLDGGE